MIEGSFVFLQATTDAKKKKIKASCCTNIPFGTDPKHHHFSHCHYQNQEN